MDNNYVDLYSADGKEGIEIKGKDVIMLDAPEVRLSPDKPLLTKSQNIADAINELFQLDPGGGDVWVPPSHWPNIPEPADNQAIFYVEVDNPTPSIAICFPGFSGGDSGNGTIDWGDGYVDSIPENYSYTCIHPYSVAGGYIITATCNGAPWIDINNKKYDFIMNTPVDAQDYKSGLQRSLKAIKLGKNVKFIARPLVDDDMYGMTLMYMKFAGEIHTFYFENYKALEKIEAAVLPDSFPNNSTFRYCYSLHDVDFLKKFSGDIPGYAFEECYSLKSVNLPNVTSIAGYAFNQCYSLKSVNLPSVTYIENGAFSNCHSLASLNSPKATTINDGFYNCYNLRSLTVADGCTFYTKSFTWCPALYPKPQ